jgi:hypothetical protein
MTLLFSSLHLLIEEVSLSELKATVIIIHISDYFNGLKPSGNCKYHML